VANTKRAGPRERLLTSARKLTYERGVAVGVDAILADADVARNSLYQHFGGKDGLIAETIRASAEVDLARYAKALERGGEDPRARLLAIFEAMHETTSNKTFRGCRYTAAELALTDPRHPARLQTRAYKLRLRELLLTELYALGHPAAEVAADKLLLLIDGVLVTAVTRPETHPALEAREIAGLILNGAPYTRRNN
jgi:AcrR family transcriptional regulator